VVTIEIIIFCDMTPCRLADKHQRRKIKTFSSQQMERVFSETTVPLYQNTFAI
jgi:hypothetical protein